MSNWMRLAGPTKVGGTPVLLGLALLADQPTDLDELERGYESPVAWNALFCIDLE